MNCTDIKDDLSTFVDGELTPERRVEVEAHVAGCAACRQQVAELQKLAAGVAAMPKAQPTADILAGVREKLARGEEVEERTWQDALFHPFWPKVPLEIAAIAAAFMIVSRLAIQQQPAPSQEFTSETEVAKNESPAESAPANVESANRKETEVNKPVEPEPPQAISAPTAPAAQPAGEILPPETSALAEKSASKEETALAPAAPVAQAGDEVSPARKQAPVRRSLFGSPDTSDQYSASATGNQDKDARTDHARHAEQPKQKLVVAADDAGALRDRARAIAASLNGTIQADAIEGNGAGYSHSASNSLFVVLPAGSVERFKSEFSLLTGGGAAVAITDGAQTGLVASAGGALQSTSAVQVLGVTAGSELDKKVFPTVVLEIQIVPPVAQPSPEPAN